MKYDSITRASANVRMATRWIGKTGTVFAKREGNVPLEEVKTWLGDEHYVEADPSATHSDIERFWVFDVGEGLALCFQYFDQLGKIVVGINRDAKIHPKLLEKFVGFETAETEGILWE